MVILERFRVWVSLVRRLEMVKFRYWVRNGEFKGLG